jgi:uncharacterized membrane protein
MNRLLRILKHRWLDERDAQRAIGSDGLARLEARVTESERRHIGEIRVCVESGLPLSYLWRDASARERAVAMFSKLRVWDTEFNSGVLIYLLLAEHRIEIVADRGLNRHVSAEEWQHIMGTMRAAFQAGKFEEGLNLAIDAVDALMLKHLGLGEGRGDTGNPNELPNAPWLR